MTEWELVSERTHDNGWPVDKTERLKVPGGWLYRTILDDVGGDNSRDIVAMVFVPEVVEP